MHFEKLRLVLPIFQQLFVNSYRLTALVWHDKKWFVLLLTFVFFALSVSSFLNSGARALLLNELVLVAGSKTVTIYLLWLIVFLLFVVKLLTATPSMVYQYQPQHPIQTY